MGKKSTLTPEQRAENRKNYLKQWREKTSERRSQWQKQYNLEHLEQRKKNGENYHKKNKDRINEAHRQRYAENKDQVVARTSQYYQENKEKMQEWAKEYRKENKEKIRQYNIDYLKNNPNAKLASTIRSRIGSVLRGKYKSKVKSITELLGCDLDFLRKHLERQFSPGMTWENQGKDGWHIDHIVPCSLFPDLTQDWQQKSCFKWENLQPLWWYDNLSKHAKLETCPV